MPHIEVQKNRFDCAVCHTRCDGKSKMRYSFQTDVEFAEAQEQLILDKINQRGTHIVKKTTQEGYPDLEIFNREGKLVRFLEIKAQRRTFMRVKHHLPKAQLVPSETLALNLSDLLRYFEIEAQTQIPTSILWVLSERPCLNQKAPNLYFLQRASVLKKIYAHYGDTRRFRRRSGKGDVVNGVHKGVVVNYHFSINELRRWIP